MINEENYSFNSYIFISYSVSKTHSSYVQLHHCGQNDLESAVYLGFHNLVFIIYRDLKSNF